mgnify:CR=1 FL=1
MDITRLDYYRFLDVEIVALNFMSLHIQLCNHTPTPEELVSFAADRMGSSEYKDPEHYMYDYLLYLADISLRECKSSKA